MKPAGLTGVQTERGCFREDFICSLSAALLSSNRNENERTSLHAVDSVCLLVGSSAGRKSKRQFQRRGGGGEKSPVCFILCRVTAECHGNRCVFASLALKGVRSLAHICRRGPPAPRTLCGRSSGLRWKGLFDGAGPAMCACVIQPSPSAAAHAAGAAGGTCPCCCFNATLISACHKLSRHLCVIYKSAVMTS